MSLLLLFAGATPGAAPAPVVTAQRASARDHTRATATDQTRGTVHDHTRGTARD